MMNGMIFNLRIKHLIFFCELKASSMLQLFYSSNVVNWLQTENLVFESIVHFYEWKLKRKQYRPLMLGKEIVSSRPFCMKINNVWHCYRFLSKITFLSNNLIKNVQRSWNYFLFEIFHVQTEKDDVISWEKSWC